MKPRSTAARLQPVSAGQRSPDHPRLRILDDAIRDLRYAVRALGGAPTFTTVAILTIALGIGSVVTIFSVVHAVLLEPLPFDRPDRLVRIVETVAPERSATGAALRRVTDSISVGELDELRRRAAALSSIAAYANSAMTLTDAAQSARLEGWRVEPDLLQMLGVQPLHGRVFTRDDGTPGNDGGIVLSHSAWQRYLAGRADLIGHHLTLDNKRYSVIGVMPPGFQFPVEFARCDYWLPLALDVVSAEARDMRLPVVARLGDGVSIEQGAAQLGSMLRAMNDRGSAYELVQVTRSMGRPGPAGAAGPVRRRGHRAADRHREPLESAPRTNRRAAPRDRDSPGARRDARQVSCGCC